MEEKEASDTWGDMVCIFMFGRAFGKIDFK